MSGKDFLSETEYRDIAKIMEKKYATFLQDRFFFITVTHEHDNKNNKESVWVTVLLKNTAETFYYPVEGRILLDQSLTKKEAALFLLDCIDTYFEEYLMGDEDTLIPIDWTEFEWEDKKFQLKGQVLNKALEQKADALLNKE